MEPYSQPRKRFSRLLILLVALIAGGVYGFRAFVAPPIDFPAPYHLTIEQGQTLFSISHELKEAHVIRSSRLFEMFMISFGSEKNISEGEYYFSNPISSLQIALRISGKMFGIEKTKVTFPEGFNRNEMLARLTAAFPTFDSAAFMTLTADQEGYLFPDTYSFFPSVTPDLVVTALKQNFNKKIASLSSDITASQKTLKDIIIMASIIEKEAKGDADRGIISGILWKRLSLGAPLQVDAPLVFILNKENKTLTAKDLSTNSLYNTYLHKGLPPGPIGNPGLASIVAAVHPTDSPYLYYLHDADGNVHYATTYAEHQQNIKKYLNKK